MIFRHRRSDTNFSYPTTNSGVLKVNLSCNPTFVVVSRNVPASGEAEQERLRLLLHLRRGQQQQHLGSVGVQGPRTGLPSQPRLADRLRVLRMVQAGLLQARDQEDSGAVLQLGGNRQAGKEVQPGKDL